MLPANVCITDTASKILYGAFWRTTIVEDIFSIFCLWWGGWLLLIQLVFIIDNQFIPTVPKDDEKKTVLRDYILSFLGGKSTFLIQLSLFMLILGVSNWLLIGHRGNKKMWSSIIVILLIWSDSGSFRLEHHSSILQWERKLIFLE